MTKDEALTKLFDSINGDCYIGQDEERKLVGKIKEALDTEQVREGAVPAQEPMSIDDICKLEESSYVLQTGVNDYEFDFIYFARAIEKAHGIGE